MAWPKAGPGRPKGSVNKATAEAREFAVRMLSCRCADKINHEIADCYELSLKRRIRTDTLAPAVETALMYYRWGKPKETLDIRRLDGDEVGDQKPLTEMNQAELAAEAARLAKMLEEEAPDKETALKTVDPSEAVH